MLTTINNYTFANIQKLRTIMLPKTLTTIKSYAFDSTAIKSIFYLGTTQMTCEDKILRQSTTETKNIRVKRGFYSTKTSLCSNREITIEKNIDDNGKAGEYVRWIGDNENEDIYIYCIEGISQ